MGLSLQLPSHDTFATGLLQMTHAFQGGPRRHARPFCHDDKPGPRWNHTLVQHDRQRNCDQARTGRTRFM